MKREEVPITLMMVGYFFFTLFTVTTVKSLQNALYLRQVGFDWRLPALYIALAIITIPVVLLYRYLTRRFSNVTVNGFTVLLFAGTVVVFLFLLPSENPWPYLVFYTWGGILNVLLPAQVWMLSSEIYTMAEAKRLFAILGTGGILGGACGGYYTVIVAKNFGNASDVLLWNVSALLIIIEVNLFLIYWLTRRKARPDVQGADRTAGPNTVKMGAFRTIFHSRYLFYLAALVLVSSLLGTLIDLQYKWSVINSRLDKLTEFFGFLLGSMFVISAPMQLLVTPRLLRTKGIRVGLLVLPCVLLLGSGLVFFEHLKTVWAGLVAVLALKVLDGCFRSSVDRTSQELLNIPLSTFEIAAAAAFINFVVFRMGDALAAAVFLVPAYLHSPFRSLAIICLILCPLWIYFAVKLTTEYVRAIRQKLEIKTGGLTRPEFSLSEGLAEDTIVAALHTSNPVKLRFILQQLIQANRPSEPVEDFTGADEMRATGILDLEGDRVPRWLTEVAPLVDHQDWRVASAALQLMCRYQPDHYLSMMRAFGSETLPKTSYLGFLDSYVLNPVQYLDEKRVLSWCRNAGPEDAEILARLMGKTGFRAFLPVLQQWSTSPHSKQARAAIEAVGRFGDPEFVELLIRALSSFWSRQSARKGLVCYGDPVLPHLGKVIRDTRVDLTIRREIPLIFTQIGTQKARAELVAALYLPDSVISYRALKALNKIRNDQTLSYAGDSFYPLMQIWAKEYYELANLDLISTESKGGWKLLRKAVKERIRWSVEKIFRGLGLFLPVGDAYFSYLGYTRDDRVLREIAVELIDSRLRGQIRHTLLPIFAESSANAVAEAGRELFHLPSERHLILSEALFRGDPWIRCCIIAAAATSGLSTLKEEVRHACQDVNPMVRETAAWALSNWDAAPG